MLFLKPQLFVSIRGPNRKALPIDKHGNGVVCHCLKWSILMKLCYNILCIFRNNFHNLKKEQSIYEVIYKRKCLSPQGPLTLLIQAFASKLIGIPVLRMMLMEC